jgi:hypothetical protein
VGLNTEERQAVIYFTGFEVEHTVMFGQKTLFVVGIQPVQEVIARANDNDCQHIYLGTSQCFKPTSAEDWKAWDALITPLLDAGLWVTLDFGVEYASELHEEGWCEFNRFIPMISVKLPYIKLYNYNTTLKIDDTTWGHSNPGVWSHHLPTLMNKETFTGWDKYTKDTEIK